mmetsp:Transcript_33844/g.105108  ORF Transcript_33844/g.105108 Transcript_33844/m.105108 type:complete len:527 (+) Transcript_33844:96-1676(+)
MECMEGSQQQVQHGIEELPDGSTYEGQFLGRDRHGWGKITWASGDCYEGQFQCSAMHGQGALRWDTGVAYSGQWQSNELGPAGTMKWPDGRQYRGHFLDGEKHGEGRLTWPDGRSYTGQWSGGLQDGYGFIAARKGPSNLSQWEGGGLVRWLPEEELPALPVAERAAVALGCGAVRLLSAMWLSQRPDSYILHRRRELPPEAFVRPDEALDMMEKRYSVVVVSYTWLSQDHPDPAGFHTRILVRYLTKHLQFFSGFDDVGVFWDYVSLHQTGGPRPKGGKYDPSRGEEEEKLRAIGLQALPYFYGGKKTVVVKLTRMPEACDLVPYDCRGWCFAESTISGMVKESGQFLDLGLAAKALSDESLDWEQLRDAAIAIRHPPLLPEDMAHALERMTVTQGDDRGLLCGLYAGFFAEVTTSAIFLGLANSRPEAMGWGDTEMKLFCRALPSFTSCKALSLANHGNLSKAGVRSLRERLPQLPALQRLVLPRHLEESKEGQQLAKEWSDAGKTPDRLVWLQRLGEMPRIVW